MAAFNTEQPLQLFLKASCCKNRMESPKTYTLRMLFLLLVEMVSKTEGFKNLKSGNALEFASLEDAYTTARYFSRDFKKGAEKLFDFFKEVEDLVGRAFESCRSPWRG
ncbi:MAG: HEPN domain-containing protein [Thermoproteota archaeon]